MAEAILADCVPRCHEDQEREERSAVQLAFQRERFLFLSFQRLKRQTRGAGLCHWDLGRRMPTTNLSLGCRPCGEFHAGRAVLLVLAQLSFLPFARHDRNFRKSGTGQTPASRSRSRRVGSGKSRRRILKREVTNGYLRGVGRHLGSLARCCTPRRWKRVSPEVSATRTRYLHSIRARSRVRYHYSQEITTLTVIWARQLVSPQPKLGPVP